MTIRRIGVLGGGAWGTALAHLAARAGREVVLWGRDPDMLRAIDERRENPRYLPGIAIDPGVATTAEVTAACQADAVLMVLPAQAVRDGAQAIAPDLAPGIPVLCCAKGLELGSGALMSEVLEAVLPDNPVGCLSGPTFAGEAARGLPTAATLAIGDAALGEALVLALGSATFRPYRSTDVVGAEVGGAVKNVLAIACGIADGQGFGENTRAALITRGLAETTRLAVALGGRPETLAGLAGLGDLAMTCASRQSRNFRFGAALGRGEAASEIAAGMGGVVEGRHTAEAVIRRATDLGVDMPICAAIDAVLNRRADLAEAIRGLMGRPLRAEVDR